MIDLFILPRRLSILLVLNLIFCLNHVYLVECRQFPTALAHLCLVSQQWVPFKISEGQYYRKNDKSKLNDKIIILSNILKSDRVKKTNKTEGTKIATAKGRKRLTYSWTAPKGLLTISLFLTLALISEFFMVSFFMGAGLKEAFSFKFFTITFSPLFHLLPLGVVLVLVCSWIYFTKHIVKVSRRKSPTKTLKIISSRSRRRKPRMNVLQRIIAAIKEFFNKIGNLSRSQGVSSMHRRLSFGRLAFESTVTVLTIFLLSIIIVSVLVYPRLFTDFAVVLYSPNSPLQGFLLQLNGILQAILSPINDALRALAPGLRNVFEGLGISKSQSFTGGDLLWRYVFCQNAAAWISALVALAYGKYFSNTYSSIK